MELGIFLKIYNSVGMVINFSETVRIFSFPILPTE